LVHAGIIADEYERLFATASRVAPAALHPTSGRGVAKRRRHRLPDRFCYALGCRIGDKAALERIREIRQTDRNHHFTLVCRDLADVGKYAVVDNSQYRLLRAHTPGPYTYLLKASRETPRRLKHERRGTIGLRVPDHPVTAMLLTELGEPIMSSTLLLPGRICPAPTPRRSTSGSSTASISCSTAATADWCRRRSSTCRETTWSWFASAAATSAPLWLRQPYNGIEARVRSSRYF